MGTAKVDVPHGPAVDGPAALELRQYVSIDAGLHMDALAVSVDPRCLDRLAQTDTELGPGADDLEEGAPNALAASAPDDELDLSIVEYDRGALRMP